MKKIECGKALQSKPAEAGLGNAKSLAASIYVTIIMKKESFSRNEA